MRHHSERMRWARAAACGLCVCARLTVAAEIERIEVRRPDDPAAAHRTLEAAVLVEALDGGLLVETPDQRQEILPPASIVDRKAIERPAADQSPREVGRRILGELPAGFDLLVTRHYVICFDTTRAYAQWCGALFERLHDAFINHWQRADMPLEGPTRPLIVVIFADRRRYEAAAARDLGTASDRVVGYYNLLTNRVTTFDLTGSDLPGGRPGRSAGRAGLEILASPEAAGLVSTLVHEATHQMAFNCGMHRRLAPVPLWVSEGIATYFETPDLASDRGWRGIGLVNRPRLEQFLRESRPGAIASIVRDDEPFRRPDGAVGAYARAWALTYFLVQTRKAAFVAYLRMLAEKEPLADDSPDQREREFAAAFGDTPAGLEESLMRFLARLK
ncbi:MAG: DUF1570 domain-containing protein [Planctomycetia bacterium]|nr:DUF1570 domain-containing protein [Planctomycetia bacterium]